jgi:hypothetical protein
LSCFMKIMHRGYLHGKNTWSTTRNNTHNSHHSYSRRNCPCCSASKRIGRSLHHTNKPLKHEGSFLSFIPDEFYEFTISHRIVHNRIQRAKSMQTNDIISCSICYDTINNKDRKSSLPCGHLFHKSCMEKWKWECNPNKASCPLCRKSLNW